jgi:hypothetical protein
LPRAAFGASPIDFDGAGTRARAVIPKFSVVSKVPVVVEIGSPALQALQLASLALQRLILGNRDHHFAGTNRDAAGRSAAAVRTDA